MIQTHDPRVAVLERALADVIWQWRRQSEVAAPTPEDLAAATAPGLLGDLDAADHLRGPVDRLKGKTPVVLYFANRADAAAFVAVARDEMRHPLEIRL